MTRSQAVNVAARLAIGGGRGLAAIMVQAREIDVAGREWRRVRSGEAIVRLRARNVGNGLLRVAEPVDGLVVEDVEVDGGYRVLEVTVAQDRPAAALNGLSMRRVRATGLQRGLARIRYDSRGGRIEDVQGRGTVHNAAIPCGIAFDGTAHDWILERCVMRGFQMELAPDRYWNGDGFSTERGNYGIRFLRCEAYDCSDGGFDLKSTGTFLDGCVAGGNGRNYRFWSTIDAHRITSLTPVNRGGTGHAAHIGIDGRTGGTITISRLVVRSERPAPLFQASGGGGRVVIASHDIRTPRGTPMVEGDPGLDIVWRSGPPRL